MMVFVFCLYKQKGEVSLNLLISVSLVCFVVPKEFFAEV